VGAMATEKAIRVFVKIEVDLEFPEYKKAMIVNLRKHSWFTYNRALDPALKPIAIGFFIRKDHGIAGKEFFKRKSKRKWEEPHCHLKLRRGRNSVSESMVKKLVLRRQLWF